MVGGRPEVAVKILILLYKIDTNSPQIDAKKQ